MAYCGSRYCAHPIALQVRSGSAAMLARTRARDAPENADGQRRRLSLSRATQWRLVSAPSGDLDHTRADAQVTHGTDAQQEAVKKRCVESNCRHGEVWQVVAKHPDNARCSPEVILRKVSAAAELDVGVPICPSACAVCARKCKPSRCSAYIRIRAQPLGHPTDGRGMYSVQVAAKVQDPVEGWSK